jgi:hypothetical protein
MIDITCDPNDFMIILDGDIEAEFEAPDAYNEPYYLAFSDATLLEIEVDNGEKWRIRQRHAGASTFQTSEEAPEPGTSDKAILITDSGDIEWVCFGKQFSRTI